MFVFLPLGRGFDSRHLHKKTRPVFRFGLFFVIEGVEPAGATGPFTTVLVEAAQRKLC